ncbi:MAG: hypothetical protein SGPRY_010614, partial [Prymnesium sp.]
IQLIIFGDSWCKADDRLSTWPELLGERLGWGSLNLAIPGSDSRMLELQCETLLQLCSRGLVEIHEDAWVLVHTGGNDIMASPPQQLMGFVGVGMPLTTSTPIVEDMLRLVLGDGACVNALGMYTLRHLNAIHIGKLAELRPDCHKEKSSHPTRGVELPRLPNGADFKVVCLDEAAAIDAAVATQMEPVRQHLRTHDGSFEGIPAMESLWVDPIHPSQRCHQALTDVFMQQFKEELDRLTSAYSNRSQPASMLLEAS